MIVEVKVLRPELGIEVPQYATLGSAGLDLCAAILEPLSIAPNSVELVPTGLAIYLKANHLAAMILPRSGLGHKKGLILGNGTGLIDSDYQGELMVSCWNRSAQALTIEPNMRFAQLVIVPVVHVALQCVSEFSTETVRAEGGFGHTGVGVEAR